MTATALTCATYRGRVTRVRRGAVSAHQRGGTTVIEVDGDLDIVTAHDLRRTYADAELSADATIEMDLSRVGAADHAGIDTLAWCVERAFATRTTLTWSTCSQPLTGAISASARTKRTRVGATPLSA